MALVAITHLLAGQTFYHSAADLSCLDIRMTASPLGHHAEGIGETAAAKATEERHRAWAARLPRSSDDLWHFVAALDDEERLSLLAHCVAGTVYAVRQRWDTKRGSLALADTLAEAVSLNMAEHWEPTVDSYLGRVTKAQIAEAVREAVSESEAAGISGRKKSAMADAAARLLAGSGWLPAPLRRQSTATALARTGEAA